MEDQIRELACQEAEKVFCSMFGEISSEKKNEFLTLKQLKSEFSLFGATLYRHINKGRIALHKIGGKSFVKRSEVENLFVKVN